jgi:hypothetical protein
MVSKQPSKQASLPMAIGRDGGLSRLALIAGGQTHD